MRKKNFHKINKILLLIKKGAFSLNLNDCKIFEEEEIFDDNVLANATDSKYLTNGLISAETVSDEETSASSAPYFSRSRAYYNHQIPIFKVNIISK